MPGVHLIPAQGLKKTNLIQSDTRHNHFIPTQGFTDVGGASPPTPMDFEVASVNWFDLDFQQRIPLTINGGQVPSTQSDLPLLINDTYPDMIGEAEAELRFAGSDLVQLEYQITKFDNSTGELIAWVRKPTVDDGDFLGIYFDNPGAIDEQNPPAVYDASYNRVYHLNSDANDSTGNAEDLTIFTNSSLGFVPGKFGNAYDFPGNNITDYMIRNPVSVWPSTQFTLEHWVKLKAGILKHMFSYATTATNNEILTGTSLTNGLRTFVRGVLSDMSMVINDDVFHKVDLTWDSTGGVLTAYLDGNLVGPANIASGASLLNGGSLVLGQDQDSIGGGFQANQALIGLLQEVVLSDTVRTADFIKTRFNNQNSNSTFYSTGAVELAPSSGLGTMQFENPLAGMEFES